MVGSGAAHPTDPPDGAISVGWARPVPTMQRPRTRNPSR